MRACRCVDAREWECGRGKKLFKWRSDCLIEVLSCCLSVCARVWDDRIAACERVFVGARARSLSGNNKGRGLAPRRPFISFSGEVIPIDSYWTASREPLRGELVICEGSRGQDTPLLEPRPSALQTPQHRPSRHQMSSVITDCLLAPITHHFLCHRFYFSAWSAAAEEEATGEAAGLQSQITVVACRGCEVAIWPVSVCMCVPRNGWMAIVGTSTSSPSHQLHTHMHIVAHSVMAFASVSCRNQSSKGLWTAWFSIALVLVYMKEYSFRLASLLMEVKLNWHGNSVMSVELYIDRL